MKINGLSTCSSWIRAQFLQIVRNGSSTRTCRGEACLALGGPWAAPTSAGRDYRVSFRLTPISDLIVSRQHAQLTRSSGGGFRIEDLDSGNGTFVNDQRINELLLEDNDEIRVGDSVLRYLSGDEPPLVEVATIIASNPDELIHAVAQADKPVAPRGKRTKAELRADLTRAYRMLETLYSVAGATSSILEPTQLFNKVLDYLFDVFPDADRGFVMLLDDNSQLVPAAVRRRQGDGFSGGGLVLTQTVVARVLREGKAVLSNDARRQANDPLALGCTMCAPLSLQGQIIGILHIEGRERGRPFTSEDLDLLSGIAMQTGVAYHNASMHQRLMRQQLLEHDLRFARRVQQSFLPLEPPSLPGYFFSRSYNPVYHVGGDFYDFIPLPEERIGVLIGDVSGKGVSAALLMARLTSDMRYYALSERGPSRVMARANNSLINSAQDNMFATVLYLVFDPRKHTMTMCNAGHIPPLLHRPAEKTVMALDDATNLALGVLPDPVFDETSFSLELGDSVLLTTDGVVEAKSTAGQEYGFTRLGKALAHASPELALDAVLKDLERFTQSTPQYDDITMVGFTRSLT